LAYQISVPSNSTLIIADKTTGFNITENQSVGVIVGTGNALNIVATIEAIT
jgi:hypothetical protein